MTVQRLSTQLTPYSTGARDVDEDDFLREALVMVELDHPHLVKMVGVSLRATPWLVVLEYLKYGDLKTVLMVSQSGGRYSLITIRRLKKRVSSLPPPNR